MRTFTAFESLMLSHGFSSEKNVFLLYLNSTVSIQLDSKISVENIFIMKADVLNCFQIVVSTGFTGEGRG